MLNDQSFLTNPEDGSDKEEASVVERVPEESEMESGGAVRVEKEPIPNAFWKGPQQYNLAYGSKQIEMHFIRGQNRSTVLTYVQNIEGAERVPNETTALYRKVAELCQKLANDYQEELEYVFRTHYLQMARWALSKGAEIFHWDEVSTFNDPGGEGELLGEEDEFVAQKLYYPAEIGEN